jgi:putative solute:sodium symporter small subunit
MNEENQFHISFFKPTTERARRNRNKVVVLVSIWAIGVFGFHFLLRAIEKPTPEPVLVEFNKVWDKVKADEASTAELQIFAKSVLQVSGKVFIQPNHRAALNNGLTWATYKLADSAQKVAIMEALIDFEKVAKEVEVLTDDKYQKAKSKLAALAIVPLDLKPNELISKFLPLELRSNMMESFPEEQKQVVATAMPLYTIHNQSVLTDMKFLGFPFHYFYTAVFLLILFIGICWFYSFSTDRINKKLGIYE